MSHRSSRSPAKVWSVVAALAAVALALGYDAVAFLPLWAVRIPRHYAATIQHHGHTFRLILALSSFGVLWFGLYGVYGPASRRGDRTGLRWNRVLLWAGLLLVLALLLLPTVLPHR